MGSHFMPDFRNKHVAAREQILAEGISEVVAELRLVDIVDYIAFLRLDRLGNIDDIVNSSAQLYLQAGSLRFSGEGDANVTWNAPPTIELGMEFRHAGVTAHFRLHLAAAAAAVTLSYLAFDEPGLSPDEQTERLTAAMRGAHVDWRPAD
ncbi:hypothetical protein GCM10011390_49010 [Aureimonas endophytica]|uniref:Uncharacterized protein n=1 Tax=Aureimonas endophytica TaxID=2027858 RepID=A0A917A303_9HYPH|nr:hypothetical protein [Aureimonas endophytica]GGE23813.1 hypothetical protein GCM10011390_49010 [Aureimonas endophytica]